MLRATYAREFLFKTDTQLFANDKLILEPIKPIQDYTLNKIGFYVKHGDDYSTEPVQHKNIQTIATMGPLTELNFCIIAKPVTDIRYRSYQRIEYVLARLNYTNNKLAQMPKGHYVLYDLVNKQLRLEGPNVITPKWVNIDITLNRSEKKYNTIYDMMTDSEHILNTYNSEVMKQDFKEFISIPELPVIYTDAGEIICIADDLPRILVVGKTGSGKSTFIHGVVDFAHHHPNWNYGVADLSDSQSEMDTWVYPSDWRLPELNRINANPLPLPCVYLSPSLDVMRDLVHEEEGVGLKIALSFDEILANPHKYFDLRESEKYFNISKPKFKDCVTIEEVINVFSTGDKDLRREDYLEGVAEWKKSRGARGIMPNKDIPPDNSIRMFKSIMLDLYTKRIVDKWSDVASKWKIVQSGQVLGEYNPIIAASICGLFPILETEMLLTKNYFTPYFKYFVEDLFIKQNSDPFLNKIKFKILVKLDEYTNVRDVDVITRLQKEGRMRRIGTIISTQNYTQIQQPVRDNSDYIFCFNLQEADEVVRNYSLTPRDSMIKAIRKLGKCQAMAYAKADHPFAVYSPDGSKRKECGPFFGTAFPPLSLHKQPLGKKSDKYAI